MRAESMDMQDFIYRVVIPEEKVVEVKDGVSKEKVKKMFPGYILVEMVMSDEAWYVVRNTPGVTGFIGSSGKGAKPTPLQPYEVDKILNEYCTSGVPQVFKSNDELRLKCIQNNLRLLEFERENVQTARENHEIACDRNLLGNLAGIEMREAQKGLLDAEERILAAEYDTKICEISLLLISGKILDYLE